MTSEFSVFPGSPVKLGQVQVQELNCSSPFIMIKKGLNAPLSPGSRKAVYLKNSFAGTTLDASTSPSGQNDILHLLERMIAEQVLMKSEHAALKEKVQEHEFWLRYLGGSSPLLAIFDVMRVFLEDLNRVSRQQLTANTGDWPTLASRAQHMSKKRKHGIYSFYTLLHEDNGEDSEEKVKCLAAVHRLVKPSLEGEGVRECILACQELIGERDDAGHPISRASRERRKEIFAKFKEMVEQDRLPQCYNTPRFKALLGASIVYYEGKDFGTETPPIQIL